MEQILNKVAMTAVNTVLNTASRAAFGAVTALVVKQTTSLITKARPKDKPSIEAALTEFQIKQKIANPLIQLLEISTSRGNSTIEAILTMTNDLKQQIENVQSILELENTKSEPNNELIIKELKSTSKLIDQIIPYLNLVMTASSLYSPKSSNSDISISRLCQASNLLSVIDQSIQISKDPYTKVGKGYLFTLFKLFQGSNRPKGVGDLTWTEYYPKCFGYLNRKPSKTPIVYQLIFEENLDDGRYHDPEDTKRTDASTDIPIGRDECFDLDKIHKIYFSTSGNLLNIDGTSQPVLVIQVQKEKDEKKIKQLDPYDYYAFGFYKNNPKENDKDELEEDEKTEDDEDKTEAITTQLEDFSLAVTKSTDKLPNEEILFRKLALKNDIQKSSSKEQIPNSALSLFEYLLRLAIIEMNLQQSHLFIKDEMLIEIFNNHIEN